MIDQLIRDYTNSIVEAENATPRPWATCAWPRRTTRRTSGRGRPGQAAAAASAKADSPARRR